MLSVWSSTGTWVALQGPQYLNKIDLLSPAATSCQYLLRMGWEFILSPICVEILADLFSACCESTLEWPLSYLANTILPQVPTTPSHSSLLPPFGMLHEPFQEEMECNWSIYISELKSLLLSTLEQSWVSVLITTTYKKSLSGENWEI